MLGEHGCVCGHGKVGEQGGVVWEEGLDMAMLVEVMTEVQVETDDRAN